jgi:hypothetical protein
MNFHPLILGMSASISSGCKCATGMPPKRRFQRRVSARALENRVRTLLLRRPANCLKIAPFVEPKLEQPPLDMISDVVHFFSGMEAPENQMKLTFRDARLQLRHQSQQKIAFVAPRARFVAKKCNFGRSNI